MVSVEDEVFISKKGSDPFTVNFNHVLYKAKTVSDLINFANPLLNMDPLFDSIGVGTRYFDFHLNTKPSPAVDAGLILASTLILMVDANTAARPRML